VLLAAAAALVLGTTALAQVRQIQMGNPMDANPGVGTGGANTPVPAGYVPINGNDFVTGNVGGLGDSYVINLKLVESRGAREIRRVSEPLHGDPDALIEEIRVAAYRLVAPEKLKGSLAILADARGARIFLDGKPIGVTPVAGSISALPVGEHSLRIALDGYADFLKPVTIRFQKVTQVMVRMEELPGAEAAAVRARGTETAEPVRFWGRWWFYAIVGVAAAGAGVGLGLALTSPHEVQCGTAGCR